MKCNYFQLRSLGDKTGPFEKELPLDEPSYGNNRYFRCVFDNEAGNIHLESHLLEKDRKAKRKYERMRLNWQCKMKMEQQVWMWNND